MPGEITLSFRTCNIQYMYSTNFLFYGEWGQWGYGEWRYKWGMDLFNRDVWNIYFKLIKVITTVYRKQEHRYKKKIEC